MRIACISDTHGKHKSFNLPKGLDLILHAGDLTSNGELWMVESFNDWVLEQTGLPKERIIVIPGNHDSCFQNDKLTAKRALYNCTVLIDEGVEIDGIKIWGRPWTPEFCNWSFMADPSSPKMMYTIDIIPDDVNILLTHGPVHNILDKTVYGEDVGCIDLALELQRFQDLKLYVCGHIHEGYGIVEKNGVKFINASLLDEHYKAVNEPIIIEL